MNENIAAESQVVLVSALLPIFIAALAIASFMNGFWMCVQGYFIRSINLPKFWFYSFHWIDYQTYAFELLANSDLKGLTFTCQPVAGAPNGCVCAYPSSTPANCTVSGDDVLNCKSFTQLFILFVLISMYFHVDLNINNVALWKWSLILIAITAVYRILFYIVLARSK
jgi:hypothetical protein